MKKLLPLAALAIGFALAPISVEAAPNVVATIKPIHSLVAAVMDGVGEPALLVKGAASPHTYALRPSDADALQNADLVFWTGHGMELFLTDALGTLTGNAQLVELAETPGLTLLPVREGGAYEAHEHGHEEDEGHDHAHEEDDHDHHGHDEGADMHFWLDPNNAKLLVSRIAQTLAEIDPDNAGVYQANAERKNASLDALEAELQATLSPVRGKPFIVFHDAYQYFEKRFGLDGVGSVTVSPDVMPGAARIDALKAKLDGLDAVCVFAEPQFTPAILAAITEGTTARTGELDPEGASLSEGPGLYPALLRNLASGLADCLR